MIIHLFDIKDILMLNILMLDIFAVEYFDISKLTLYCHKNSCFLRNLTSWFNWPDFHTNRGEYL